MISFVSWFLLCFLLARSLLPSASSDLATDSVRIHPLSSFSSLPSSILCSVPLHRLDPPPFHSVFSPDHLLRPPTVDHPRSRLSLLFSFLPPSPPSLLPPPPTMSGNTVRGTPSRGQPRGQIPFQSSPGANSNIPRPVPDAHSHVSSETTPASSNAAPNPTSSVSASRQKQSKRDEVRLSCCSIRVCHSTCC